MDDIYDFPRMIFFFSHIEYIGDFSHHELPEYLGSYGFFWEAPRTEWRVLVQ
jgi:hypothetical protein